MGLVNPDDNTGATAADSSIKGHLILPMTAAVTFLGHPILGVGPGMHRYYYQRSLDALGLEPPLRQGDWYAHDLYLGVAADTGLLGLGCFLAIVYITLRNLVRVRKRWIHSRPEYAHMATGFLLALVNYLVSGIGFHFAYIRFFWLMMALGAMATYVLDAQVPVEESPDEDKAHVAPQPPRPLKVVS